MKNFQKGKDLTLRTIPKETFLRRLSQRNNKMSRRILSFLTSFLIVGIAILSISGTAYGAITYVRSNGTGSSTSTTLDIGSAGTDRLVVVFADHESTGVNLTGATVDGKSCTLVAIADNPTGAGNHLEMWYICLLYTSPSPRDRS